MLKEEFDDLALRRSELDEIISDLYELKPLLEKCENNTLIKGYNKYESEIFSLTEWYIRTKPLLKNLISWLSMYYEQKIEIHDNTESLKQKIKKLRHDILMSFNKS